MQAMIFAAGLGTRLRPLTNDKPKALVEIKGKTLLEITIMRLKRFGFSHFVVNVHHFADQVTAFLQQNNHFGCNIMISDERELLLDTGGGLKKARPFFTEAPILIHNVDAVSDIDLGKLYDDHVLHHPLATLATCRRTSSRYLLFDTGNRLVGWMNEKTGEKKYCSGPKYPADPIAFSGIQVVEPVIFDYMPDVPAFSIIDVYLRAGAEKNIRSFDHTEGYWRDVGKPHHLLEAEHFVDTRLQGNIENL